MSDQPEGITGDLVDLYDVFVDWPGRLSREMPGVRAQLDAIGARRVLDIGCGTGRHIQAMREAGYEAFGTDVSPQMLERAAAATGAAEWFVPWRLGDPPAPALSRLGPFDAITCLGNVWPQVVSNGAVQRAAGDMFELLRPGGLLLMGLKAVAIRRERDQPYMPLLRREHEGRPIYFIRVVDFDVPAGSDGQPLCDFHMIVVRGDGASTTTADLHDAHRIRVWSPPDLERTFTRAGFEHVAVSGSLADAGAVVQGEDVFVHARRPA